MERISASAQASGRGLEFRRAFAIARSIEVSLGARGEGVNVAAEATAIRIYLVFDFGEDREAAGKALAQIEHWIRAFKLHGQLLACENRMAERIQVVVRLAFEEFEKLAFERWLERIPREEAFAAATVEILRPGDDRFDETDRWFAPV